MALEPANHVPLVCAIPLPLQLRRQLKRASGMCCLLLLLLVLPWLLHVPAASTGSGTGCGWGHPHRGHTNSCTHLRENLPLPLGLPLPRSSWYVARTATVLRLLVAAGHERHSGGMEVSQHGPACKAGWAFQKWSTTSAESTISTSHQENNDKHHCAVTIGVPDG